MIQGMLAIWSRVLLPFLKSSLNIWNLSVHVLLKPSLENFEHYFANVWDECNCVVVWTFFGTAFLWDWSGMHLRNTVQRKMMLEIAEWGLQKKKKKKNTQLFFLFLAVEGIMCDLSFLTKDQIHAPCIASRVVITGAPGKSPHCSFAWNPSSAIYIYRSLFSQSAFVSSCLFSTIKGM